MDYGPRPVEGTAFFLSDDFARGRDFTYDLMLRHPDRGRIRELTDITMLTLRKDGSDGVGIAEIELLVNGVRVFERFFGETASTCLWLDEGDGSSPTYTIDYPELRATESYLALQKQLAGTERRIAVARKDFNESVFNYNRSVKSFPANIVAGVFGFKQRQGFTSDAGAEQAVEIKFEK
jgi:hypothetical protein